MEKSDSSPNLDPEASHVRSTVQRNRQAWSDLLFRYPFAHFVTLTFRWIVSRQRAIDEFNGWIRHLGRKARHPVGWFYALEVGAGGLLHFHVLLSGTEMLTPRMLERAWRGGRADASVYEPHRGARYYITKDIPWGNIEYDIADPRKFRQQGDAISVASDTALAESVGQP